MLRVPGNINPITLPVITNHDGSISTTLSFSAQLDGVEVLLPMIVNGVHVSKDDAISRYRETGEHLGIFDTWQEADRYSLKLHDFQVMVLQERGLLP
jgi:hypothetical protein